MSLGISHPQTSRLRAKNENVRRGRCPRRQTGQPRPDATQRRQWPNHRRGADSRRRAQQQLGRKQHQWSARTILPSRRRATAPNRRTEGLLRSFGTHQSDGGRAPWLRSVWLVAEPTSFSMKTVIASAFAQAWRPGVHRARPMAASAAWCEGCSSGVDIVTFRRLRKPCMATRAMISAIRPSFQFPWTRANSSSLRRRSGYEVNDRIPQLRTQLLLPSVLWSRLLCRQPHGRRQDR